MSKRYRRHYSKSGRTDAIIIVSILVFAAAYNRGVSATDLVNLAMAVLLVAAIIFAFVHFAIKDWQGIRTLLRDRQIRKALRSTNIDAMTGIEFEYYVAELLRKNGYTNVRLTEKYDLGIDIIAQKGGITWGIQVKRYQGLVGIDAVRQVCMALKRYKCDRAMAITNSTFSRPAKELAKDHDCVLIDRAALAKLLQI